MFWLGRIRKKKGIKETIEAAIKSGENLIISGVVDNPEEKAQALSEGKKEIKKREEADQVNSHPLHGANPFIGLALVF